MSHGRAAAARFTGTRAIASPRFVGPIGRDRPTRRTGGDSGRPSLAPHDQEASATPNERRDRSSRPTAWSPGTTYRLLLTRGLAPDEAANLTAFLCGIPIAEVHWSLRQVNQLLFLREMARTGRFGSRDGEPPRPH